ncbi:MAG: M48 family metalloprotease [Deltaproteobacteria bacterium]|nr:M48 family metalloprotease [Deltaproteobacteria bacterium]
MKGWIKIGLLMAGAVMAGGCALEPFRPLPETGPGEVSASVEAKLGERLFPWTVQKLGGSYSDPELRTALEAILRKLSDGFPCHLQVLNHSRPAALVFPGGFIGLTRGLLLELEEAPLVAAVLAHQIGHLQAGHLGQALRERSFAGGLEAQLRLEAAGRTDPDYGEEVAALLETGAALQGWSFSPRQEREADDLAVPLLRKAGYDPRALPRAMKILRQGATSSSPWPEKTTGWQRHVRTEEPGTPPLEAAGLRGTAPRRPSAADAGFALWHARASREAAGYLLCDQALRLESQGNSRAAVGAYLQAAAVLPDEPLVLARLGLVYLQEEDLRNARFHLERALMFDPHRHPAHLGLGFIHLAHKEYPAARKRLETAMELLPTLQGAYLLGSAWEGEGDRGRAARLFSQVAGADAGGKLGRAAANRLKGLKGF